MRFSEDIQVRLTDTSLRDGSHAKAHQFTVDDIKKVVTALDSAGMPVIEVAHGDGLGGSSFNYGFSNVNEMELIKVAIQSSTNSKIAALMLPGLGTKDDILKFKDIGGSIIRIATHCTEADIADQHFSLSRELGLETVGFLMMAHTVKPETLAKQGRIMADSGCQCVYVVDSAGALIFEQTSRRVSALVTELGDDAQVGFHGHQNLGIAIANSIFAIRAGAVQIDGSTRSFGAGAGNTPLEAFIAICEKIDIKTGVDVLKMFDVAETVVRPIMDSECIMDRLSLIMGYAGVYSSFLKHAYRAADQYNVSGTDILLECGERKLVGGQEDQIIHIAAELAQKKLVPHNG
ncbi:MAG: 4-hydroxy-2-oxovalerate aldolase [Candidatus Marinimicrobia bacterium]|nr:4-hydroxy-2-oxovalerate aldolase [Candidatus Neomarinimicrobiota bacterium]|tara:strand:+ start:865 stop:1905 length:1041 start_codon:yes stop_codon:yes gene_type:complete